MFSRKATLVGLATMGILVSAGAVASASPPSGFTGVLVARGQSDHSFGIHQRKGNDVATTLNTLEPGGFSGWHSHPGTVVLVVQSGQVTIASEPIEDGEDGECSVHTYTAGQVFLERPGDRENVTNTGTVPAVVEATLFNVPHGGSLRIDQPDPGDCPG